MKNLQIALLLGALVGACDSGSKNLVLFGNIRSNLTSEETRTVANIPLSDWVIVESNKTESNDPRPPYALVVIEVSELQDLGEKGRAKFYFFNDRLMSVSFYPKDIEHYRKKLTSERNAHFVKTEWTFLSLLSKIIGNENPEFSGPLVAPLSNNTRVTFQNDYLGKFYFSFEDIRLVDQHQNWILKYS
jgi:hypothetical protein